MLNVVKKYVLVINNIYLRIIEIMQPKLPEKQHI